jgi:hypothetical protein
MCYELTQWQVGMGGQSPDSFDLVPLDLKWKGGDRVQTICKYIPTFHNDTQNKV